MSRSVDPLDALVYGSVDGDRESIEALLAFLRPLVVRYCRARLGAHERVVGSADDVAQEVCIAVLKALPTYRALGRPFVAFVYGIAANKVADVRRSMARSRSEARAEVPEVPVPEDNPEERALTADGLARIEQLMATLTPRHQEILRLRVVVGLSAEETARAIDSSPGAVRVAQHRALTKLRHMLDAEEVT